MQWKGWWSARKVINFSPSTIFEVACCGGDDLLLSEVRRRHVFFWVHFFAPFRSRSAFIISVILSPFNKMRPNFRRDLSLMFNSSASSKVRFMYSSKPIMRPSIRVFVFSYNQTWTRDLFCRNLKIRLIGCVITFFTLVDMVAKDRVCMCVLRRKGACL